VTTMPMTAPTTPQRSLQQRLDALKRANEIRMGRAQLKRDMKAGRKSLLDVLAAPPACAETAKTFEMLLAAPKIGRVKANAILTRHQVSPSKTLAGLTDRQRTALMDELRARSATSPSR
jgi:hypothetical protein